MSKPSSVLINDARLVLTDSGIVENRSILVMGRKIVAIGEKSSIKEEFGSWDEVIDGHNCLAIPGFLNNHSHLAMTLFRGIAEDLPLFEWLREKVWPLESRLKPWQVEIGAILGSAEALMTGTTSVTSIYIYDPVASEASATEATGIRSVVCHGIFDRTEEKALDATKDLAERFHGKDDGRIRVATSPHSPYSCSPGLLKRIESLRQELNEKFGQRYPILNTLHVSETKQEIPEIQSKYRVDTRRGVVDYLYSLGVLNSDTVCAHSIHLTEDDYIAFNKSNASIVSCPISNLKVGAGIANLPKAISNGTTVSLGTDGAASNNSMDMFETTKIASLLGKEMKRDATGMTSRESFIAATEGGAMALHRCGEIGTIRVGARADIVLLDLTRLSAMPFYDAFAYIVYAARSGDVRDVLVDGRIIVRGGSIQSVDLETLHEVVSSAISSITDYWGQSQFLE